MRVIILFLLLGLMLSLSVRAEELSSPLREKICLSGTWKMLPLNLDEELAFSPAVSEMKSWKEIEIPFNYYKDPAAKKIRSHQVWFGKEFFVPETMKGKRIIVSFGGVKYKVALYINDTYIGSDFGGYTPVMFDITEAARAGSANRIIAGVTDWTASLDKSVDRSKVPVNIDIHAMRDGYAYKGLYPDPQLPWADYLGICPESYPWLFEDVWLVAYGSPVYTDDVFVIPSFRNKELSLEITLKNTDRISHKVCIKNVILDKNIPVKNFENVAAVPVPASGSKVVRISSEWENPKLWTPDTPHLYQVSTILEIDGKPGKPIDRKDTRFGFREVWVEGDQILLNGVKTHLWGQIWWVNTLYRFFDASPEMLRKYPTRAEQVRNFYKYCKDMNLNSLRFLVNGYSPMYFDLADETGLLGHVQFLVGGCAGTYGPKKLDLGGEEYVANLYRFYERRIKFLRNHPSIIIWSAENERICCGDTPENLPYYVKAKEFIEKIDPTRPVIFDGEYDLAGECSIINSHEFPYKFFSLVPDEFYWLEKPQVFRLSIGETRWNKNKPLILTEYHHIRALPRDGVAFYAGDDAYISRFSAEKAFTELMRMNMEAFHFSRIAGATYFAIDEASFTGPLHYPSPPNSLADEFRHVFAPLCVSVREYDSNFYSGEKVSRTISVYNDTFGDASLKLKWQIAAGTEKILKSSEMPLHIPAGDFYRTKISFELPRVDKKMDIKFVLELSRDEKLEDRVIKDYSIFPSSLLTAPVKITKEIALFDRNGRTSKILDRLGVDYKKINSLNELRRDKFDILIIGYKTLKFNENISRRIDEFTQEGGNVVCFEQKVPPSWVPIAMAAPSAHASTISQIRAPGHPLLEGLDKTNLRYWKGDHIVSRDELIKPTIGNFRVVLDTGTIQGLTAAPLLEVFNGKGVIILNQMLVTEKFEREPVSPLLIRNILKYACEASFEPVKVAGIVSSGSSLKNYLDYSIGLVYENVAGKLSGTDLDSYNVLFIDGEENTWKEISKSKKDIRDFLEQGGKIFVHRLKKGSVDAFNNVVREVDVPQFSLEPRKLETGKLTRLETGIVKSYNDGLFSGISNHDFHWLVTEPMHMADAPPFSGTIFEDIIKVADGNMMSPLTKPSAMVKIPYGKGHLVVDQINWDTEKVNRDKANRLICSFLTNLGATLDMKRVAGKEDLFSWAVIGPFENLQDWTGLDTVYSPETQEFSWEEPFSGIVRDVIRHNYWRTVSVRQGEFVDFLNLFDPNQWTVAYAMIYVYSPDELDVLLHLGSDDGMKVWLNDKVVWRVRKARCPEPDEDQVAVTLSPGWNKVLVKVEQGLASWGFFFHITDKDGKEVKALKFGLSPK